MQDRDTFNDFINELIDKNDILEVVRGYVDLTRKGNSYWGRCPFHHEKTASFHVEERMKIYKCFGCGAAGNVIKFIQEIESVSFMEAVKILADRVGMKVPEFSHKKDDDLEERKKLQERHYEVVRRTARYYNHELVTEPKVMDYLKFHGIDSKLVTAYGLGFSGHDFKINDFLFGLDFYEKEIEDAGVCRTTPNDKFVDCMAGKIICPIINTFGKVVGFAGTDNKDDIIYTKNTDIFRKDQEIFGAHVLKNIKIKEGIDNLILTSSPLDAVALRGKGYNKVVSVLGNTISSKVARALMRYTDKFTVVFNGVAGGIDKNYAGLDALINEGASVKIATLVEDVSVMKAIRTKTFDKIEKSIKSAKSLMEYQLNHIALDYDLTTKDGKNAFIEKSKEYIMTIKERSKQEPYISVVSALANVREDSIRKMFYQDADKSGGGVKRITHKKGKTYNATMQILALMNAGYDIKEDIEPYLEGEYKDFVKDLKTGKELNLTTYFNDAEIKVINGADINDKNNKKLVADCIKILKEDAFIKKRDEIIKEIENEQDMNVRRELMEKLNAHMRG